MSLRKATALLVAAAVVLFGGIYLYLMYGSAPTNVAYVTEEQGQISVIDLKTLKVIKRAQPNDVAPRGIGITFDGKHIVTANKDTSDATVFSTKDLTLERRLPVGASPEFIKLDSTGNYLFTSFEPGSAGGPPKEGAEQEELTGPPSQIIAFDVKDWNRTHDFVAGKDTEGLEFSADGKLLIVANEAQNTLGVYDVASSKKLRDVDLKSVGIRPRGIKRSPTGDGYAVTMESSGTLLKLDNNFNVVRSTSTGARPYGVAFDRAGKRIFVAAAMARKLQIFQSDTLQPLGEVAVGQRCWHFTFTPDDSKILLACGRSNNLYVIDPEKYSVLQILDGFKTPWGVMTYPRSYGSLDLP